MIINIKTKTGSEFPTINGAIDQESYLNCNKVSVRNAHNNPLTSEFDSGRFYSMLQLPYHGNSLNYWSKRKQGFNIVFGDTAPPAK
ncbi:MAG: hypothetical protein ACJAXX_000660 [Roseivirga sp.]